MIFLFFLYFEIAVLNPLYNTPLNVTSGHETSIIERDEAMKI